jgi:hypothetical protein
VAHAVRVVDLGQQPPKVVGSGVVVRGRVVLTAAHVVRDRDELGVRLAGGVDVSVVAVSAPEGWDVAALVAEHGQPFAGRSIRLNEDALPGQRAWEAWGCPTVTRGANRNEALVPLDGTTTTCAADHPSLTLNLGNGPKDPKGLKGGSGAGACVFA